MPRKPQPWFRFYVEAFGDRKILRLSPAQRWLWAAILGAARESPDPGRLMIAEGVPMTVAELARYADVRVKDVADGLAQMEAMQMVTVRGGIIEVTNWDHRQFESDNVTARTAAHRERSNTNGKERSYERSSEHPQNVPRARATETETETETEKVVT
jgi:hypothetical protein